MTITWKDVRPLPNEFIPFPAEFPLCPYCGESNRYHIGVSATAFVSIDVGEQPTPEKIGPWLQYSSELLCKACGEAVGGVNAAFDKMVVYATTTMEEERIG